MIDCYNNAKRFIVRHEKGDFSLSISENGNSSFTAVFVYSEDPDPGGTGEVKTAVFSGESLGDLLAEYNTWMRRCMKGPYLLKEIVENGENTSV